MAERRNKPYNNKHWNSHKPRTSGKTVRVPDSPRGPLSPNCQSWQKKSFGSNSNRQNIRKSSFNDCVRRIVQAEGRSARNLITWNVPPGNCEQRPTGSTTSSRSRPQELKPNLKSEQIAKKPQDSECLGMNKKDKKDIRARYWAFLFDNLERAVDEIYKTCESDESDVQCKEVIMMLEHSSNDFKSLIERLRVIREFESAQTRPTSVAWELRKTSPGKTITSPVVPERLVVAATKRILNFAKQGAPPAGPSLGSSEHVSPKSPMKSTCSYADRVRGIKKPIANLTKDAQNFVVSSSGGELECLDLRERSVFTNLDDGWKTVHGRRYKNKVNGKTSSTESLISNHSRPPPSAEASEENETMPQNTDSPSFSAVVTDSDLATHVTAAQAKFLYEDVDRVADEMHEEGNGDADLDDEEDIAEMDDDYAEMQAKLFDDLEVMNEALHEEQALEMNNNIEDAVAEQLNEEDQDAVTEETGTQTVSEPEVMTWEGLVEAYKASRHLSWGEMVDVEERTPGRSVQMHEKLSSPSRKPSTRELSKKHEEKQFKAQQLRKKLLAEKAERLRELAKKVDIVTQLKEEIGEQRRDTIKQKMRAAEQKRNRELRKRMQKAHDEETKANEIAFINSLEAQNKKHDIEIKHQECQARLMDIAEERQRRNEEKAAKEAAVEERRKALEADRQSRLQEMQERRRQREAEFEQRQLEKEKERVEAARAKEKDREERVAAIKAQQQAQIEELRAKIQEKQDESARRHSEKLDQIREKAFEMTILRHSTEDHSDAPKLTPYDKKKLCLVCNTLLPSEVHLSSHLRGKKHRQSMLENSAVKNMTKTDIEEFNLTNIKDAPSDRPDLQLESDTERRKALRKRCKKLRQRMSARGTDYENSVIKDKKQSDKEQKLQKCLKDINKALQVQSTGPWAPDRVQGLERALFEVGRILDKNCRSDAQCFCSIGGVTSICRIMMTITNSGTQPLPNKTLVLCANTLYSICLGSTDDCRYMLYSNKLGVLVDFLASRFTRHPNEIDETPKFLHDQVATALMNVLFTVFANISGLLDTVDSHLENRINDVISYLVCVGVVDRINLIFSHVRQPIENNLKAIQFLDACLQLIYSTIDLLTSNRRHAIFDEAKLDDTTLLIPTMANTEICSVISLVYSILLNTGSNAKRDVPPSELSTSTLQTVTFSIQLLNAVAKLSMTTFQSVLGNEGTWLEFRHICSYLIWYCAHFSAQELLHQVILSVGYFTVLNTDNQVYIQSGQSPTVLQQLCSLPFQYFSNKSLTDILFPTLIACSYNNQLNRQIFENELSCALLANYIEENYEELNNGKATRSAVKLWNRFPIGEFIGAVAYYKS